MRRYFLFVLIILFVNSLHAQNAKIDSLKALLPLTKDAARADLCRQLASSLFGLDNKECLAFAKESLNAATEIGDSLRMIKAARIMTGALRGLEKFDSAIIVGSYCERIAHRNNFNSDDHGTILNGLGLAYLYLSKYDHALSSLQKAYVLFIKSDDKESVSIVLNNIGVTYYKLKDYRLALQYFEKSLNVNDTVNNSSASDNTNVNISICYAHLDSLKKARTILQLVIEKCPSKCSDKVFVNALYTSGFIWYKSDSLRKAEEEFLHSYSVAKKTDNHRFVFDNIIYLSKIYLKRGDLMLAERFLMEGDELTTQNHFALEEMKIYEEFSALFKAKGYIRKVSFYQTKYIQMNDSIYSQTLTSNLMQLHAEATEKEYKAQLTSQEQMLELKSETINKQLGINLLIGLALILFAILVFVLIRIFNDSKLANTLLIKKVNERTAELGRNRQDLLSAIEHQDKALTRWKNTIGMSVKSMNGLCSKAMNAEPQSDGHKYFVEIDNVTGKVSKSLDHIQLESTLSLSN